MMYIAAILSVVLPVVSGQVALWYQCEKFIHLNQSIEAKMASRWWDWMDREYNMRFWSLLRLWLESMVLPMYPMQ